MLRRLPNFLNFRVGNSELMKVMFQLGDGGVTETVFVQSTSSSGGFDRVRNTVCVSSQIGCMRSCDHCCSGVQPFQRNLTCDELLGQVAAFAVNNEVHQVAFQGQGEPLDNPAVCEAANFLSTSYAKLKCTCDSDADAICAEASESSESPLVCVSTIGNSRAIRDLADAAPSSYLNLSLMPGDRWDSIPEVLRSTDDFAARTGKMVALSYTMVQGLDTEDHLDALVEQMGARRDTHVVNLVQYHAGFDAAAEFASRPSDPSTIRSFIARLRDGGVHVAFGQYCEFPPSLLNETNVLQGGVSLGQDTTQPRMAAA